MNKSYVLSLGAVSTVTSQTERVGSNPAQGLPVLGLHVLHELRLPPTIKTLTSKIVGQHRPGFGPVHGVVFRQHILLSFSVTLSPSISPSSPPSFMSHIHKLNMKIDAI